MLTDEMKFLIDLNQYALLYTLPSVPITLSLTVPRYHICDLYVVPLTLEVSSIYCHEKHYHVTIWHIFKYMTAFVCFKHIAP